MAYQEIETAVLSEQMCANAQEFSLALQNVAAAIDADISTAIRKGVFDVFRANIKRSPVDTGAYRASHGIANAEPASTDDIVKGEKGKVISATEALSKGADWTWKIGDGDIYLFNNLPYAERIENGWSDQAGDGVYRVSLAEFTQHLNVELAKLPSLEPMGAE